MCMNARDEHPNKLLTLGMMALVVANVGGYVMRRTLGLPESVFDPVSGFLLGLAIAMTLLGVRRHVRSASVARDAVDDVSR